MKLDLFASLLVIIMIATVTALGVSHRRVSERNEILKAKVDSLTTEVKNLNISLDESTNIALSLADRLNRLYEIDKEAHKKLFIEAN